MINQIIKNNKLKKKSSKYKDDEGDPSDLRGYLMNEVLSPDVIEDAVDIDKVKSFEDSYKQNKEKLLSKNTNVNKSLINAVKKNINNRTYNSSIDNVSDNADVMHQSNNEITKTQKISKYMSDDPALQNYWENMETTSDT